MFLAIGIPMTLQLLRNHEETGSQIKQTWREARKARKTAKLSGEPIPPKNPGHPITVKGPFGKTWTFHVKFPPASFALGMFRAQTHDPVELTKKVLSDEKLRKALAKQGITVMFTRTPDA
jgi:hypothetical protein